MKSAAAERDIPYSITVKALNNFVKINTRGISTAIFEAMIRHLVLIVLLCTQTDETFCLYRCCCS